MKQKQRNTSAKVGCFFKASAVSLTAFPCKPLGLPDKSPHRLSSPSGSSNLRRKNHKNPNINDNDNPNLFKNTKLTKIISWYTADKKLRSLRLCFVDFVQLLRLRNIFLRFLCSFFFLISNL
jgi:hypothetical protein